MNIIVMITSSSSFKSILLLKKILYFVALALKWLLRYKEQTYDES